MSVHLTSSLTYVEETVFIQSMYLIPSGLREKEVVQVKKSSDRNLFDHACRFHPWPLSGKCQTLLSLSSQSPCPHQPLWRLLFWLCSVGISKWKDDPTWKNIWTPTPSKACWGMSWHQKNFTENQKVRLGVGHIPWLSPAQKKETAVQNSQRIITWQTDPNDKASHRNSFSFWYMVLQIVVLKCGQLIMPKFSFCLLSAIYL